MITEINIMQRLLMDRISSDRIRFIGTANNEDGTLSMVIYDEKIGSKDDSSNDFKNMLIGEIDDLRTNWMQCIEAEQDILRMVVGHNGDHLDDMLKWSGLGEIEKALIQASWSNGKIYLGLHRDDERLYKLKGVIQHVIDHCQEILLSPKEYQYLMSNRRWNLKQLMEEFPKSCLVVNTLTADRILFYGNDRVKQQIINRIRANFDNMLNNGFA